MVRPENKLRTNTFKPEEPEKQVKQDAGQISGKAPKTKSAKTSKNTTPWYRDERAIKLTGSALLFLGIYLILAFSSFFYFWFIEVSDDIISNTPFSRVFLDTDMFISNHTGNLGAYFAQVLVKEGFGAGAFFIAAMLVFFGLQLLTGLKVLYGWKLWRLSVFFLAWLPLLLAYIFPADPLNILGGVVGWYMSAYLASVIGNLGIVMLLSFVFLAYLIVAFNISFRLPARVPKEEQHSGDDLIRQQVPVDLYNTVEFALNEEATEDHPNPAKMVNELVIPEPEPLVVDENMPADTGRAPKAEKEVELDVEPVQEEKVRNKGVIGHQGLDTEFDPTLDLPDFRFPPLDLLSSYGDGTINVDRNELEANKNRIVETLGNYAIGIEKIKATIGPTVTLYEIIPAPGVRISRIKGLEDDIALSLSALGIRIIAPIPGKGTVGIEVPNQKPEIVSMRSIIGSEKFTNNQFELPFALGKTIANESFVADLTRMPHILMAGATGQGKSVGLNAIITSLLFCKHPAELKFVLVDPKKVELSLFSRIERHYLAKLPDSEEAIITDTRKVVRTLNSLTIEMNHRYELLKDAQVRNIKEYNTKFRARRLNPNEGHRFLPYIVLVVDEFADLIMTAGKEIEGPITRLAQLARAVGIHLIIATQRPSVNIITGTIKANFPARIAFRVISRIDSRTILDTGGADQLVGRGDMLLSTGNDLIRLQCAFIDTPEVEKLTDYIGSQRGYPDAFHLPEYADEQDAPDESFDPSERDELFEDAARIIVQNQQGSTSLLQRKLKLGYNRAGRIIDQLEAAGIVGPFEGSKAREVKVANEMALEQFLKDIDSR
jgi:S-DNA-T family DNA segregation ATPase FtsK/SpoIIIE